MPIIVGMHRLVGNGVTHAHHNGTIDTTISNTTACGTRFVGYDLDYDSESPLRHMFRTVEPPGSIVLLRGTFENRPVDCMSCLVRMRTWDQRWT